MRRTSLITILGGLFVILSLLLVAGCGAGGSTSSNGTSSSTSGSTSGGQVAALLPPPPPPSPRLAAPRIWQSPQSSAKALARSGPLVVSFQVGWNFFSMPFSTPTTFVVDNPAAVLACYGYDASSGVYVAQTFSQSALTEKPGETPNQYRGLWVYCSSPVQLSYDGLDSTQNPLQTNLVAGWNLVGTPLSSDVALTAFKFNSQTLANAVSNGLLGPDIFTYNPATKAYDLLTSSLKAGQSAWMYTYQPGILATIPPPPPANLLVNGSFEQPPATPGSFIHMLVGDATTMPGWTVVGGPPTANIDLLSTTFSQSGFTWTAQDGAQSVDVTGYVPSGTYSAGVAQNVTTVPGLTYTLSFYIGNLVDSGGLFGSTSTIKVLINDAQVFQGTNSGGSGSPTQTWQQFNTHFTATTTTTKVTLMNGDPASDTSNGLDNCVLTENPP